jgi:hypothetical protein
MYISEEYFYILKYAVLKKAVFRIHIKVYGSGSVDVNGFWVRVRETNSMWIRLDKDLDPTWTFFVVTSERGRSDHNFHKIKLRRQPNSPSDSETN